MKMQQKIQSPGNIILNLRPILWLGDKKKTSEDFQTQLFFENILGCESRACVRLIHAKNGVQKSQYTYSPFQYKA